MVQYLDAIKLPFKNKKTLLIATLLGVIPIVALFVTGYVMRTAKQAMYGKMDLPSWKNYKDFFILGLKTTAIFFIYVLPVVAIQLLYIEKYLSFLLYQIPFEVTQGMNTIFLYSLIYFMVLLFLLPAALSSFLETEKIRDAFKPSKFYQVILSLEYWFSVLVVVLFSLGVSVFFGIINLILQAHFPTVEILLLPFFTSIVKFIIFISAMVIFAQTHKDITSPTEGKI